jgi:SAM-dependent methyltransferase
MRSQRAGVFGHPGVAAAYRHRPPYPRDVFATLERLVGDRPRHVLDLGAGEGALARPLAERMDRVDAVDVSAAMVAAGRERPGGRRAKICAGSSRRRSRARRAGRTAWSPPEPACTGCRGGPR